MSSWHENGEAQLRQALDHAFARRNGHSTQAPAKDEQGSFCCNPAEYDWTYVGKRNMLIPYKLMCHGRDSGDAQPGMANADALRLEMHNVWVVEGILRRGESNLLARRRIYIDEDSWQVLSGEGYDSRGMLTSYYMTYKRAPSDGCQQGRWVSDLPSA